MKSVYSAVGTGSLNKAVALRLQRIKSSYWSPKYSNSQQAVREISRCTNTIHPVFNRHIIEIRTDEIRGIAELTVVENQIKKVMDCLIPDHVTA